MSCALESYASTLAGSPTEQSSSSGSTIELTVTATKKYRRTTGLHVMPDSTHRCPEYVWGDEGPVNE
jgi:hypothetical protein